MELKAEDWQIMRIGDILNVRHGKSQHEVATPDGAFPIYASGGEIGRSSIPLYNKPSVLIGRKGTIDSPRYSATPFWTVDTLFYTEISELADPKFVYYKFNLIPWRNFNEASGVPSLNARTIENIELSLPPTKAEQEAIAEALSDADALIASLEQLIAKKRLIKQGAMQELLTGKRRLPGFSGDLKCGTLCELIEAKAPKPTPRGFCTFTFLGMEDISEEGRIIRQSLRVSSELKSGFTYFGRNDIIVAKITPCFENGKGAFLGTLQTEIGYGSTEFHVLRAKAGVDPRYVYFQTRDTEFRRKLEGEMIGTAGQKRVPRSAILDYQMPVVHTSKEQTAIATVLSEMDEEIGALETKLAKARLLKQGMMQELLTGRIRLV